VVADDVLAGDEPAAAAIDDPAGALAAVGGDDPGKAGKRAAVDLAPGENRSADAVGGEGKTGAREEQQQQQQASSHEGESMKCAGKTASEAG
jgi:hypothetical protein